MKSKTRKIASTLLLVLLVVAATLPVLAAPMGTAFTYQGRLYDKEQPAEGKYDLQFALYDAATDGSQIGSPVLLDSVQPRNGLFKRKRAA